MAKKIRVLLVEDNEDERLFMKEGFLHSGVYEIIGEAENGNDMLDFLKTSDILPDVITSDLNMPGRNGYEVIVDTKTNSSLSHIPVIILTTAPLRPYAEPCKKLGACAYYTKPDTFLEHKEFAEQIYDDVKQCLSSNKHLFNKLAGNGAAFMQLVVSLTGNFFNPIKETGNESCSKKFPLSPA